MWWLYEVGLLPEAPSTRRLPRWKSLLGGDRPRALNRADVSLPGSAPAISELRGEQRARDVPALRRGRGRGGEPRRDEALERAVAVAAAGPAAEPD